MGWFNEHWPKEYTLRGDVIFLLVVLVLGSLTLWAVS